MGYFVFESMSKEPKTGVKAVVEILNNLDTAHREKLLQEISEREPRLAEEIKKHLFVFEDFLKIAPKELQLLIRSIPPSRLALALRKATNELKNMFFENMSKRASQSLQDEIQQLGPQKLSDVQKAQNEIIEAAKKLETEGKILLKN